MSVQSLGHFIVRMTVDYKMLKKYRQDTSTFFPVGDDEATLCKIRDAAGDLTHNEIQLIRDGDWEEMFLYIETAGDKPLGEDQPNYP